MAVTRQYTVDHGDYFAEAEKLMGKPPSDPKPGEEKLVCVRCHALRMAGTQLVVEAVYEATPSLFVVAPPEGKK